MKLNKISKAYFINLDRRADRLDHIKKTLPFLSARFSAIDCREIELTKEVQTLFPSNSNKLTKAEICCAISHYKLWKKLSLSDTLDNLLIMEDDICFDEGFATKWNSKFSRDIPEDFFLIYLGGCQPWNAKEYHNATEQYNESFNRIKKTDFFHKGSYFWHMTTCSYVISRLAAFLLCNHVENFGFDSAVDHFIINFVNNTKPLCSPERLYHLNPLMGHQIHEEGGSLKEDQKSDIRNSFNKFDAEPNKPKLTKIIHQSWKDRDIPFHIYKENWIDSWKNLNPEWEYKLWTDEDNLNLVKDHYPEFLELYTSYEKGVDKADIARFLYMHKYGGIYVDLDFKCLKPLDDLFEGETMVLGRQEMDTDKLIENVVPNAFKYSSPGEKFWIDCVRELPNHKFDLEGKHTSPEVATGPIFLVKCLEKLNPQNLKILEPKIFYPISWDTDGSAAKNSIKEEWESDPEKCFPEAYAVTYWTCAWREQSQVHIKKKALNIIWQSVGGKDKCFESDWIISNLNNFELNHIEDEKLEVLKDNSIIVYGDMINPNTEDQKWKDHSKKTKEYFKKFKEKENCFLIHLSDEFCHADTSHYQYFNHVFRNYYRQDAEEKNVSFFPLGYKKGFNDY